MFLGEAPDLDVFFGGFGPGAFWLQHRGITHSFFGVAIQAVLFFWIFSRWDKGPRLERLWHYAIPLFLHVCCDYLTSYGIPLLSPFNFKEFSGDFVPAITLVPLVFMLLGLGYLHRNKKEGWVASRPIWAAWGLYLLLSLSGKAYAFHLAQPLEGKVTVVSGLMNPASWTAVAQDGACCRYRAHRINTLFGKKKTGIVVDTDKDDSVIRASLQSPGIRRFVETTRWPVARKIAHQADWKVEWGKMLFSSRGMVRGQWSVDVDAQGHVSNETRIFNFWTPGEKS